MQETKPRAPKVGDAHLSWLRQRLVAVVQDDMVECNLAHMVDAVVVLEIFERVTG